ncbi:hypothetical protein AB0B01_15385 [Streptomyces sp. NPDC044571]|uniref:hypothetical protein n=1 Tax=Streptomyces sp. NPDC044571 TaxID=3155371 RepID=UPI0033C8ECF1
MTLVTVLILVAALALIALLALAPSVPARLNAFPGRRRRPSHRRGRQVRLSKIPGQRNVHHHAG